MRYKLSIDRTVNRLVPHYLSGRRFILFVQSCLYPLQCTNERFRDFTKEMHIRARMTSQVIYFEWFLNYKFGKYIRDGKDRILIRDSERSITTVRPYRRYNKYSIGKLLGKCSNIYLSSPAYLPTKGRQGV